jgi:hypothetical protein
MTRRTALAIGALSLVAAARPAVAQPAPTPPPPPAPAAAAVAPDLAPFLEKRVPEELATEGVVLSRSNLSLQVQPAGAQLLVSLVDMTTGRVAASTKIDQVPADREAAVAMVTHVAADLVTEIAGRPAAPPPPPAPAPAQGPIEVRDEGVRAAMRYQRNAIRFGATYDVVVNKIGDTFTATQVRRWQTYQGDQDELLDPLDFYREVGRPDLADEFQQRHKYMIGGYVVAGVGCIAAVAMALEAMDKPENTCGSGDYNCEEAWLDETDRHRRKWMWPTLGAFAVGTIGALVGTWYHYHPHPIDEREAHSLAEQYNRGLRKQLGVPDGLASRAGLHLHLTDVALAPYADPSSAAGGLALSGRF